MGNQAYVSNQFARIERARNGKAKPSGKVWQHRQPDGTQRARARRAEPRSEREAWAMMYRQIFGQRLIA